jgi:uncharacterized protein (TIGR02270 family)
MAKRIIPSLARRYAEEASFQWIIRERAVRSPNQDLRDLLDVDERLEAYLDGLRVSGDAGWEACAAELSWQEPGEIFTAAVLALESGGRKRLDPIAEAAAKPELARALASALGWLPWERARPWIESLSQETPELRYAAVAGASLHRQWLPGLMEKALRDPDARVRARAFKACGENGRIETLPILSAAAASADGAEAECRFRAAWSATLLDPGGATRLAPWAAAPGPHREAALHLYLRALPPDDALAWLDSLGPDDLRIRVLGLGWIGAAGRMPWLLEQTREPAIARLAAASITWITGAGFLPGRLGAHAEPGLEDALEESGQAETLDRDYDWPNPPAVEAWWQSAASAYDGRKAYALGQEKGAAAFANLLARGKQCHRLGGALESALRKPGTPLPECRAAAVRQTAP